MSALSCSLDRCASKVHARGLCWVHYTAARLAGTLPGRTDDPSDLPGESWKRIPGVPLYEASDHGRIRSWNRRGPVPFILTGSINPKGYRHVAVAVNRQRRMRAVHVLVALTFLGARPAGKETRHLDGDSLNNRPSNLVYGTHSENELDKVEHGTHQQASKARCSKGHLFDEANTYRQPGTNSRHCRACNRAATRAYKARMRAGSR